MINRQKKSGWTKIRPLFFVVALRPERGNLATKPDQISAKYDGILRSQFGKVYDHNLVGNNSAGSTTTIWSVTTMTPRQITTESYDPNSAGCTTTIWSVTPFPANCDGILRSQFGAIYDINLGGNR